MRVSNKIQPERRGLRAGTFLLRVIPAFLMLLGLFYWAGPYYARALLPLFVHEIDALRPEYRLQLAFAAKDRVAYEAKIPGLWTDRYGKQWSGRIKRGGFAASNLYIAPIIIFSILLAWPHLKPFPRLMAVVFALPLLLIVELLDMPLLLVWQLEMGQPLMTLGDRLIRFWGSFLANGGKQFLAVIAALAALFLAGLTQRTPERRQKLTV